jgi:hypothetical protein
MTTMITINSRKLNYLAALVAPVAVPVSSAAASAALASTTRRVQGAIDSDLVGGPVRFNAG